MKKVIFSLLTVMAVGFITNGVQAQSALKIGVFDLDMIVQAMPEMKNVETKIDEFNKDSLGARRDAIEYQYNRADSSYKADSTAGKSKAVLDYSNQQRQQYAYQLINWRQIAANEQQRKYQELARPLYEKANKAFTEEVKAQKITLVLKPDAISYAEDNAIINLFEPVAKKLGIDLNAAPAAAPQQ